jgi:16S rRNA (uracil1498-N3)-methyltransferase
MSWIAHKKFDPYTSIMPRFFINALLQSGDTLTLPAEVAQHARVLRLQPGDTIVLFNGMGGEYQASIVTIGKREIHAQVTEFSPAQTEPPYWLTLAQGIADNVKMDWLTEKAVELGAARIVPLTATRSVVRLAGERAVKRQVHWQRIVQAACEQCGRNRLPEVAPVQDLHLWLDALPAASSGDVNVNVNVNVNVDGNGGVNGDGGVNADGDGDGLRILLSPRAALTFHALPLQPPEGEVIVLIGPEGGLSEAEETLAQAHGFIPISLGPRVLRTETAGIAMLAALAARWGGW